MSSVYNQKRVAGLDVIEVPGDPEGNSIIFFHGFGADGFDLFPISQIHKESPRPTWFFPHGPLEIPIQPGYVGKAWFPINFEALKVAYKDSKVVSSAFPTDLSEPRSIAERLIKELDIPRSKLILGGFSQGAVLATDVALNGKEKIKGLVILSGTLVNEKIWGPLAKEQAGTSFFQSHGIEDTLLPIDRAKDLESLLLENGWQGELHAFRGGHEIPQAILLKMFQFLYHPLLKF